MRPGKINNSHAILKLLDNKILYQFDDRQDFEDADAKMKKLAIATAILTYKNKLKKQAKRYILSTTPYEVSGLPICQNERFSSQPLGGDCTGFLVNSNTLITAGHCVENSENLESRAFVFGFHKSNSVVSTEFNSDQVYYGKKLVAQRLSGEMDFAVIRLDRNVTNSNISPLEVQKNQKKIFNNMKVGAIGYPNGLPVKLAFGEKTRILDVSNINIISANVDTYGGNSGSPVFSAEDGKVIGILVRGNQDWVINYSKGCVLSNIVGPTHNGGESISRTSQFLPYIN